MLAVLPECLNKAVFMRDSSNLASRDATQDTPMHRRRAYVLQTHANVL